MNKRMLLLFSVSNVILGVFYGLSDGPYVEIEKGRTIPTSELLSSGGEDGFVITLALLTFTITAAVALVRPTRTGTVVITYTVNYLIYAFLLFLAQLDTALDKSIRLGDWPLMVGLVVPVVPFFLMGMVGTARGRQNGLSGFWFGERRPNEAAWLLTR